MDLKNLYIGGVLRLALLAMMGSSVGAAQVDGTLNNPIVPGDHPDPTIIRVGKTYWTASTAGNWAPEFSLYRSNDLRHWTAAGAIFAHTPEWADRDFWAPELVYDGGRVLVYYVGHKRGGPLCVAVATATGPAGPYEDHGPIECQEDGSIDPAMVRDEHGTPYLIWKEDGNSKGAPTPIWAQPLTPDLLHVTGEKTQLIVNEPETWEGGVVEAPYVMRHKGMFYLFYAGNACCGVECKYAEGVARSEKLLGPWVKDPANPIIRPNGVWKCPGHGTAVETPEGKDYFLFHAYPAGSLAYLGRESVIDSIDWGKDGWPVVNGGRGPGTSQGEMAASKIVDDFKGISLSAEWKWPVGHEPLIQVAGGNLALTVPQDGRQSFVARSLLTPQYEAVVEVPADGGLGLIGDAHDDVVLYRKGDVIELWQSDRSGKHSLWKGSISAKGKVSLSVYSTTQGEAEFSYQVGDERAIMAAGKTVALKQLLPWDSGLRVGLVVDGVAGSRAAFSDFRVFDHHMQW
jgi:xylan 1,4-beta-xylosidase